MKKSSTVAKGGNEIFKEPKLTIGLDLGDRASHYCILDEAGNVILEHSLPTTPKGIHQVFSRIPRRQSPAPVESTSGRANVFQACVRVAERAACKSLRVFSDMSPLPKMALPATNNSAPARTTSPTVSKATPPSTSIRND
jgi:hypothetical protein